MRRLSVSKKFTIFPRKVVAIFTFRGKINHNYGKMRSKQNKKSHTEDIANDFHNQNCDPDWLQVYNFDGSQKEKGF
jgi:hypothetical protein